MNRLIKKNYSIFNRLLSTAEFYLRRSDLESSTTYCQIAAEFAWRNHCGIISSPRVEEILQHISKKFSMEGYKNRSSLLSSRTVRRVLHVMTEAYAIGGHTQMVRRWIAIDNNRTHSVFLTRQGTRRVPENLFQAIKRSGGQLSRADLISGGWISRALALKRAIGFYDAIVLHTHPYDVLPMLGIPPGGNRPPVIFMNHADHSFWIGVALSDAVTHFRYSGYRLSVTRRGVDPDRSIFLPIPLDPSEFQSNQADAKQRLNLSEQNVVLLSIASAYKYRTRNHHSLLEATLPIIRNCPNAVLLVVGPKPEDFSFPSDPSLRSRIRCYGRRDDNFLFYPAADIYLDSLPFSSITSLLEAGSLGLPLVSLCPHAKDSEVFCADDPALDDCLLRFTDTEAYQETLIDLVRNAEFRKKIGSKARDQIHAVHVQSWPLLLEKFYLKALSLPPKAKWKYPLAFSKNKNFDETLLNFHLDCGIGQPLNKVLRAHYRFLPFKKRLKIWAQTIDHFYHLYPDFLFPEWLYTFIINFIFTMARRFKK